MGDDISFKGYFNNKCLVDTHNSNKKFGILSKEILSINRDNKLEELGVM